MKKRYILLGVAGAVAGGVACAKACKKKEDVENVEIKEEQEK